ncbi:MAG: hypothetical protein R3F04_08545 [Lysobacteraceae bacterium]
MHTLLRQSKPRRKRRCRPDRRTDQAPRDISARPPVVDERSRIGGLGTDHGCAHGGQALVTLDERRSRRT